MILSAHQLNYLPYPGLFSKINLSDKILISIQKFSLKKKVGSQEIESIKQKRRLSLLSVPMLLTKICKTADMLR